METNNAIKIKAEEAIDALASLAEELRPGQDDPGIARILEIVEEAFESLNNLFS